MRRVVDRITERIRAFLKQRDYAALTVGCTDDHSVVILKILEEIDESATSEWFWTFTQPFTDTDEYVSAIVKDFAVQHEGLSRALELRKQPPWPPIPGEILDESRPPVPRLRELIVFSRALLGGSPGALAVWVLCPLAVKDAAAYRRCLSELLRHDFPFPWFHHTRIILREEESALPLEVQRVDSFTPDLSEGAMEQALEDDAADPNLPLAERVQALFLSAQRDSSYGRFDEALRKHEVVLKFHSSIQNAAMVALVLNSVGEIHQRQGRPHQAEACFEAALEPACAGPHPPVPVLYNTVVNLAVSRFQQGRFDEAESFYDAAEKLATIQRDPRAKLQAIEKLGDAQALQGKQEDAVANWRHGAEIGGKLEIPEMQASMLTRLRDHFAATDRWLEQQEVENQLAVLRIG